RVQIDLRKEMILCKQVIGHQTLTKKLLLCKLLLLAVAGEQEEELRLEGGLLGLVVEAAQERVVVHLFQHHPGLQLVGQDARQRRLADPDRALDGDVPCPAHGLPPGWLRASEYHARSRVSR